MWEIRVNKNTEAQSINAEHIEAGLFSALLHMIILCWFLWSTEPADIDQFSDTEVRELAGKHDLDDAVVEILVELAKNLCKQKKCLPNWGITVMYLCWTYLPLTCCSRLRMTATAWWRIRSFVWGFSLFKWSWHIRPSSLNASLISRTRKRSLALLAIRLSFSLSIFCSGFKSSSSLVLLETK